MRLIRQKKYIAMIFGLISAFIYLGCKNMVVRETAAAREPATYVDSAQASIYGTRQFAKTFEPKNSQEEGYHNFLKSQIPDGSPAQVEFPPSLTPQEVADLWHLSEGSDVFPLRWFVHLKSQVSSKVGTPLAANLDEKFGVIEEQFNSSYQHTYPFKAIGLTAAWSDANPTESDAKLAHPNERIIDSEIYNVRKISSVDPARNGKAQIAMVGTNCALCHTGRAQIGNTTRLFDGAPNMMYIRGFFQDMAGSALKTMLETDLLTQLLKDAARMPDADAKKAANDLSARFRLELLGPALGSQWGKVGSAYFADFIKATYFLRVSQFAGMWLKSSIQHDLFTKRAVVQKYLTEMLALTYGLKVEELSPTLRLRMKWLAALLGADPSIQVTNEGYARTDAFGRISNWVARGDKPIDLVATVSVPPMWAIKYKASFHYNGNTNSVLMRNIGQAFGLGAILIGDGPCSESAPQNCRSTANLHNLNRLESLLYKLRVPNWEESFPEARVELEKMAIPGCTTFQNTCAGCHETSNRVGPQQKLIRGNLLTATKVGTDPVYAQLQGTEVISKKDDREIKVKFREALFSFTKNVRDEYFREHGPKVAEDWQRMEFRGPEVFRDTYTGEPAFGGSVDYMNGAPAGSAYIAKNLAGVWATAPYLHNGSVQDIESLLTPPAERSRFFFLGTKKYNPDRLGFENDEIASRVPSIMELITHIDYEKLFSSQAQRNDMIRCAQFQTSCFDAQDKGNKQTGHPFGTKLSTIEKRNLIEFLKILRPDPEYSWTTPPRYKVVGKECFAVKDGEI